MRGQISDWFVVRRGLSPPAGGEFLCPRRQRNQNAAGDGSDEHFVLIAAHPIPSVATRHLPLTGGVGPGPHLRGLPLEVGRILPAHKIRSDWVQFRPAPPGAWVCKICFWRGSASAPLSIEPTLPVRFRRRGDPCGRPRVFPLEGETCRADEGEPWNRRVPPTGHESVRPESHSPSADGEIPLQKLPQKIPSPTDISPRL